MLKVIIVLVLFLGQFPLQYFLSARENRWLGCILIIGNLLLGLAASPIVGVIVCAVHLLIYRIGRVKARRRMADRVDKMNIQDLG